MNLMIDFLSALKNANAVGMQEMSFRWTRQIELVVKLLKKRGLIDDFKVRVEKNRKRLFVVLKYSVGDQPVVSKIVVLSKPGRRFYVKSSDLSKLMFGVKLVVVSTSQGIKSADQAKKKNLGGEAICQIF